MKHTDPSGEFFVTSLLGVAIGVVTNGIGNLFRGQAFFKGAGKAALFGALGGAAAFGIGEVAGKLATSLAVEGVLSTGNSLLVGAFQKGAHAVLGGTLAAVQGGKFGAGALSGAISSGVASGVNGIKIDSKLLGAIAKIGASGLSGGAGSVLGGGKFLDGLRQGLISGGLNHGVHSGWFGPNVAAAAITQRLRHLLDPDAIALSLNGTAGVGGAVKLEGGIIKMLRGVDKGEFFAYEDKGLHFSTPSASGTISGTGLYYSGNTNFTSDVFFGLRYEVNAGIDVYGASVGITAIHASVPNSNNFVLGFGGSIGIGANATILDINGGIGETNRMFPWKN
ncbi:hypothetical protein U1E44_10290 [Arenibacter sp. GZD96]|nr:hypothetical protein [Arenibacter sp. GZD-96]